jgi:hypothetical protein
VGEKPEEIRHHIEQQRERLEENLEFLETRVKRAADWRTWVARKPLAILGAAFGGGLILALKVGR